MKNLFLSLLVILLLCSISLNLAFTETKDVSEANAYDWENWSDYTKMGYANGFLSGSNKAAEGLSFYVLLNNLGKKESEQDKIEELVPIYGVTVGQITQGVDEFYKDYKNKQIKLADAVLIVCKEVKGEPKEKIERETQILRMPPEKQGIERSKDYIKEQIKSGKYKNYELKDGVIIDKSSKQEVVLNTQEDVNNFYVKAQPFDFKSINPLKEAKKSNNNSSIIAIIVSLIIGIAIGSKFKKKTNE